MQKIVSVSMNYIDFKDEELIIKYQTERNDDIIVEIVRRYLKISYNFSYRFVGNQNDAEEIVQESFIKLWKNIGKFKKDAKFKTWFLTTVRNTALDYLRKKKDVPFSSFDEESTNYIEDTIESGDINAEIMFEQYENKKEIEELLESLSPNHRQILYLYFNEELTLDEISKIIQKPLNTVKSQYRRALINLRSKISAPKFNN